MSMTRKAPFCGRRRPAHRRTGGKFLKLLLLALLTVALLGKPSRAAANLIPVTFEATVTSVDQSIDGGRFAGINVGDTFEGALAFAPGCSRINTANWCQDDTAGEFTNFGPITPVGPQYGPFEIDFWDNSLIQGTPEDGMNFHEFFLGGDGAWQILGWTPALAAMACPDVACVGDTSLWPSDSPLTFTIAGRLTATVTSISRLPVPPALWVIAVAFAGFGVAGYRRFRSAD
jgi:hypothetical protein